MMAEPDFFFFDLEKENKAISKGLQQEFVFTRVYFYVENKLA